MKRIQKIFLITVVSFAFCMLAAVFMNLYVISQSKSRIISPETAEELCDVDCIVVLGCLVKPDGTLSGMLRDRLRVGVALYKNGVSPKLLMSGDHGREDYDEVGAMKQYAVDNGIPSEDIFMDHAGFSTYDSICRAKKVFGAKRVVIVTQKYHLYRALYIAEALGLDAYGVPSDLHLYRGQSMRELREVLARCKDIVTSTLKPNPAFLGETLPVSGNGDITNGGKAFIPK